VLKTRALQIPLGLGRVAKEDTRRRARRELVSGCGAEIGITLAPEHAQVIVRWRMPVEELVGCVVVAWTTRAAIERVSGGIQGLGPERRRGTAWRGRCR
jgi:hypothetical protein